jgi:hypothetical protein
MNPTAKRTRLKRKVPTLATTTETPQVSSYFVVGTSTTPVASTERNILKKRKPKIKQAHRQAVWRSEFPHQLDAICGVCKYSAISAFRFHCGHIIAAANGGSDHVSNLRPICDLCNQSMYTEELTAFEARFA